MTDSTTTLEDGVWVTRTTITLANGETATRITVPIVTSSRVDTIPAADTAKVQLGINDAYLPTGFGLTATVSANKTVANSAAAIKAAIDTVPITHTKAENAYLSSYTQKYLSTLKATDLVNVVTIAPVTGEEQPTDRLSIVYSSVNDALIIDTSKMAQSAKVLSYAGLTTVLGAGSVDIAANSHYVIGDDASQVFTDVSRGGTVFSGGGDDILITNLDKIDQLFHGGKGYDTVELGGARFEQHAGYVLATGGYGVQMKLINVETIKYYGVNGYTQMQVEATTQQTAIATLYQNILGRQADPDGFEYWDNQVKAWARSLSP